MAASARLMILMSPEERAALDAKARALGVSAGEVVRRAVEAFELGTQEEAAELRALVDAFNELHPETLRIADECHRQSSRELSLAVETQSGNPPWEGDRGGVSLYGDAIRALRQVILLDERVRISSADLARMAQEIADLRDRVSRLEGMLAASMAGARQAAPARDRRRLPAPPDQG